MKPETIKRLLAHNAAFYDRAALAFSRSRSGAWPGWEPLLARFSGRKIAVLDLGCGNGRFFRELERRELLGDYTGVDTSRALLELARTIHPSARFIEADATALATEERFDLVVAFGLLHHLPSTELREEFAASLRRHLVEGGLACVTFWRFADRARFRDRMVAFDADLEVEPGDYMIDFADQGPRYCHHSSEDEIERLLACAGMKEIDRYSADGETGDLNLYCVLAR